MGDVNTRPGAGAAPPPFSAEQIFDPNSPYARMRGTLKPDAKLRGFFHHLAVQQKAKRSLSFAAKSAAGPGRATAGVVVSSAAPGEAVDADVWPELVPFGDRGRLLLSFRIRDARA